MIYALLLACLGTLFFQQAFSQSVVSGTNLQIWPCAPAATIRQSFLITNTPLPLIKLGGSGLVLNVLGYTNATGGVLNVWTEVDNVAQQFSVVPLEGSTSNLVNIRVNMNGLCAGTENSTGIFPAGQEILQEPCANVSTVQWIYTAATGQFVWARDNTMCLDAGTSVSCADSPYSSYPYCNWTLSPDIRLSDLLNRMEDVEKAAMLSASNNGIPRLGVPALKYGEALHGVVTSCGAPYTNTTSGFTSTGCPSSFPTGSALGATFNRTLFSLVGQAIGIESRALFNQGVAQSMFFTPNINPSREIRWGRAMESASEDPFVCGEFGAFYIDAFQTGGNRGDNYLLSIAFPKHFSGYDQEGNGGAHDRTHFCAPIEPGYLVSYFWPSFKQAIQRGKCGGLMCAASGVNGAASCAHSDYNNGVLRQEWGWEGAMVTDGNGVGYLYETYGEGALDCEPGATGPTNACRVGLHGGVDVELGETLNNYALAAISDGNITMSDIDLALSRTMQYYFKLGLLDPPSIVSYSQLGAADVDTQAHRQLAYEAAQQSIILLSNPINNVTGKSFLPLNFTSLVGSKGVAVIGPNANASFVLLANYHGTNTLVDSHTPLLAIQERLAAAASGKEHGAIPLQYAVGCVDGTPCNDTSGFAAAITAASTSQITLVFLGLAPSLGGNSPGTNEGEEDDRVNITLPGAQEQLLLALADLPSPVVLVLQRGAPVSLSAAVLTHPNIVAILDSIYAGEMGGDAIADVLSGAISPSGRLSSTIYPVDFPSTRSIIDYNMSSVDGITYQYYTGNPLFSFGYGLSYTTFEYVWMNASSATPTQYVDLADIYGNSSSGYVSLYPPAYAVNVTNTGTVASDVSVLAFLTTGIPGQPISQLFDFQRASAVNPGQTVTLMFTLSLEILARVDVATGDQKLFPGHEYTILIGDVSKEGGIIGKWKNAKQDNKTILEGKVKIVNSKAAKKGEEQQSKPYTLFSYKEATQRK